MGEILYVRVQALRRRGIPNWGVFGRKDLQGGGPMIDIGVHALEMAHFMIGAPTPKTVTGNAWTYMGNQPSDVKSMWPGWDYKSYTVEDLATGMVRFDTGAMLSIEASFVAHIKEDVFNVNIIGTKGGANWELKEIYADQNGYMMNLTPGYLPKEDYFFEKMKHFIEVCRDGRENESDGSAGPGGAENARRRLRLRGGGAGSEVGLKWHGRPAHGASQGHLTPALSSVSPTRGQGRDALGTNHGRDAHATANP